MKIKDDLNIKNFIGGKYHIAISHSEKDKVFVYGIGLKYREVPSEKAAKRNDILEMLRELKAENPVIRGNYPIEFEVYGAECWHAPLKEWLEDKEDLEIEFLNIEDAYNKEGKS